MLGWGRASWAAGLAGDEGGQLLLAQFAVAVDVAVGK